MTMTCEEMEQICQSLFGKSWKSKLAREMGVYVSTVNRWATGFTPISKKNELAIRGLAVTYKPPQPQQAKRTKEVLTVPMP